MAPSNVQQLDPYAVGRISEMSGRPRANEARELLEAVARQVQPIMRRRQLTVPSLVEFFPDNSNLLGLNVGGGGGSCMEIRVRLRPARDPASFMAYDSILGTMLHELVHCHISPHNAAFYKLLDELNAECDDLIAKGISGSGAGFDAPAAGKVGGRFTGRADDVPPHRLRELARQAAEARLKRQAVMSSGPRITGGDLSLRHLPPREAAAAAAERRLRDNRWCPTEALGNEAAAGHDVNAALQAILDNAGAGQRQGQQQQQQQQQAPVQQTQQTQQQQAQQQRQLGDQQPVLQQHPQQRQQPAPQLPPSMPPRAQQQQPQRPAAAPQRSGADVVDLTADDDEEPLAGGGGGSRRRGSAAADAQWACPACTLINAPLALACDACGGLRPAGWRA